LPSETDRLREEVEKIRKDISLRSPELKGDEFLMTVGGKEYRERREVGLELLRLAKILNEKSRSAGKEIRKEVGRYAGLSIAIHASGLWDNHFAEIFACGNHFSFGTDIRVDSDPVGLIRSLHHSVYNGMERKLASCERMLANREATRPGLEKMSSSRFAKAAELEEKEARYKVVVAAIQERNEKQGNQAQENRFEWEGLDQLAAEKVREDVNRYMDSTTTVVIAREDVKETSASNRLAEKIGKLYAIQLPDSLLSSIDHGLCTGKFTTKSVLQMIGRVIRDFDSSGPRWHDGNGDGLSGSFSRKNGGGVRAGDMLIRKESDSDGAAYKAYLVVGNGGEKYLGSDRSLPAVKERARRFYIFNGVSAKLRGEAEMARKSGRSLDTHKCASGMSLE
jgi:hypothetical protein